MKKIILTSMLIIICIVSACDVSRANIAVTNNDFITDETTIHDTDLNEFFFPDTGTRKYNAQLNFTENGLPETIEVIISELANYENGKLYIIEIIGLDNVLGDRSELGIFYVDNEQIVLCRNYQHSEDVTASIFENSSIVCNNNELPDKLDKDERGFHEYIRVDGDKREYRGYSNLVETGYYESFIWEKNAGLVYYLSGFGAARDQIELWIID